MQSSTNKVKNTKYHYFLLHWSICINSCKKISLSIITYFFILYTYFSKYLILDYLFCTTFHGILFPYQFFYIIISNHLSLPQQKTIALNLNNF